MDTSQLVQDTYNKIALKYHRRYSEYSLFFVKFSTEFIKLIPKNGKILDLGCGTGRDSKFFSEKGFKVTAVDFSREMLKIAKKFVPEVKFILRDIRTLKLPQNSFTVFGFLLFCYI